jgi:hypothetical protein
MQKKGQQIGSDSKAGKSPNLKDFPKSIPKP